MQDDTMFGLELKPKRNGNRRKVKLDCVKIHEGRPVYRIVVEKSDGDTFLHLGSIPVLDPYFAPIWPATADETEAVAEPASWTGTENRPPGACIGGRTPFSGKYYYYVWFEEPPTEGEAHE